MTVVTPLASAECQVWWARPSDAGADLAHLYRLLDQGEWARCARYVRPADRARYVVAHALVRLLIGVQLAVAPADLRFDTRCPQCGDGHGKPRLNGAGPRFSISHSGDRVAVALTAGARVGVDVEKLVRRSDVDGLARAVLAPEELRAHAALAPADRRAALLTLWVRKEALLKATGQGLAIAPSSVTLTRSGQRPRLLRWEAAQAHPGPVRLHDLQAGQGYAACVAVLGGSRVTVNERNATALLKPSWLAPRGVDRYVESHD